MSDDHELYLYSVTDAALRSVAAQRKRAEQAEAAIQRVREVCSQTKGDNWYSYNQGYDDALDVVESALEGDSDD